MSMLQRMRNAWAAVRGLNPLTLVSGGASLYTHGLGHSDSYERMVTEFRSWVYKCVNRRGQDIGRVHRRASVDKGEDEWIDLDRKHPLSRLLAKPNAFMTGYYFFWYSQMWLDLTGNVYLLRFRNALGKTAELWPLDTRHITIVPDATEFIKGYEYNLGTQRYMLAPGDVIHIKYPNPLSVYYGASPLMAAAYSVDIDIAAKKHQNEFLRHNPAPRLAFESDTYLTPETVSQLRNQIREVMTSTERGLPLISHQGAKAKVLSLSPQEIDYLVSVENARDEIITTFGVPSSILGISKDVNKANEEAKLQTYSRFTLDPLAQLWDEALATVCAEYGADIVIRHDNLVPADREQDRQDMRTRLELGVTSINEERRGNGWDPVDGGDEPLVRVGLIPLSQVGEDMLASGGDDEETPGSDPQSDDDGDDSQTDEQEQQEGDEEEAIALRNVQRASAERAAYWQKAHALAAPHVSTMTRGLRKYFLRQADDVVARMRKSAVATHVRAGDPLDVSAVMFDLEDWNAVIEELGLSAMYPGIEDAWTFALEQIDGDLAMDLTPESVRQMMRQSLDKLKGVNGETKAQLEESLAQGLDLQETLEELTNRVMDVYKDAVRYRAQTIARTTQTQAINRGMIESWNRNKVAKKMWISARSENSRAAHLDADGQTVSMDDPFIVNGESLMYPGDPAGSAGNVINCQCFTAPVVEK